MRETAFMRHRIERDDLPVQMGIVQIEIDHKSQTVTLGLDDYYPISEYDNYYLPRVDPSKEYAIVTQKMPEASVDQNHYGQEEVYRMVSDVTRHLASDHYEMSRVRELEILQNGLDPLINIKSVKERYAMNQEWDGGEVERHLRQVYDRAGTQQEKARVAELIAIAHAWPAFHEEVLYPGSRLHELLTYIDFTLYGWTHGDPKLANIYRGTNGYFFYLDPIGDIGRPGYSRLLYEQEGLADVAMFAADLMAHVYTPHDFQEGPGLQDLPSTILGQYLHRLSVDHSIPSIMPGEVMSSRYLYNQELKFCYYAAARSRMLATAALLGDNNPAMIEPYLRVCNYFMTKARQLLATPDTSAHALRSRCLNITGPIGPIPTVMIPDTYAILRKRGFPA